MDDKRDLTKEEFFSNIEKIKEIIKKNRFFFFYFSPDPDAVGCSVAFSLYLRQHYNKECYIYLPEGFDQNLDFLFDIAVYNNINVIKEIDVIYELIVNKEPVFVCCDTPTHFLLPEFEKINKLRESTGQKDSIEIDHHFGGDSEKIFEESTPLFSLANSCCEIFSEFLNIVGTKSNGEIDYNKFFPRNIVLSLLVGICFDTQFGKYVTNRELYEKWFYFLSDRLKWLTWGNPKYINNAEEVFATINKMSKTKQETLEKIAKKIKVINYTGLLLMPHIEKYESLAENKDSTCIFSKLITDLSNLVPERSGAVGILAFYDTVYKLYFYKIRRSLEFKEYDLREIEGILEEIFGAYFLGGGGHPGATSFRIAEIPREEFDEKTIIFHRKLSEVLKDYISENFIEKIKNKKDAAVQQKSYGKKEKKKK
ncbi:MAG TPA: hypothetical protein PLE45_07545 [Spirochaetota bacterium]|nr:hypothetical protein [Spirochaetota bacterium]HOL56852.1 hypothetical protein [Spirochaetota bacterium]HPP04413.1 hypothetical protein [Spirochaetota bacterium]